MLQAHSTKAQDLKEFQSAQKAFAYIQDIYEASCKKIKHAYHMLLENEGTKFHFLDACYPYVGVDVSADSLENIDASLAFGMVDRPGSYGITVAQPTLFKNYYIEQLTLLQKNHQCKILVGKSFWPLPLPFVIDDFSTTLTQKQKGSLKKYFVLPNLSRVNDDIVNANLDVSEKILPLALFTGERVDYSLNRLHHYTGTHPRHFQNFILLTNYQKYTDSFVQFSHHMLEKNPDYTALISPGNVMTSWCNKELLHHGQVPANMPQMPAYHLKHKSGQGITFINIGVGPTNAKNITDHLAVLRPHCWIMLGHCAGLRDNQHLGDYIMAHAYVRHDHVLNDDLPSTIPLPAIAEVQVALQQAVANITAESGRELKNRMRTGTIITTDNRNWELRFKDIFTRFRQSRAIALDMESATIAGNGFRFRVPYGTLLCVSDKPIHGEIKLQSMATDFYSQQIHEHLHIGIEAIKLLQEQGADQLHSRKLRSFDEPPFR